MKIKQILSVLLMLALVLSSVGMVFATEPTSADNTVIIDEDEEYRFSTDDFAFSDDDGDSSIYVEIQSLPTSVGASFVYIGVPVVVGDQVAFPDIGNNYLRYTPAADEFGVGYDSFTFTVIDSAWEESVDTYTITINVNSVNNAPEIGSVSSSQSVEGGTYDFQITGSDLEGDALTFSIEETSFESEFGTTSSFDPAVHFTDNGDGTADFYWDSGEDADSNDVSNDNVGIHYFTVSLSDGENVVEEEFYFIITNVNDRPDVDEITYDGEIDEFVEFSAIVYFNDVDNDLADLTVTASDANPYNLATSFDPSMLVDNGDGSATLTWTPVADDIGFHQIIIDVYDGQYHSQEGIEVTVMDVNDPPTADSSSITIDEDSNGNIYTFDDTDFEVNYVDNEGNAFDGIVIASLPDQGSLEFNSVEVSVGDQITANDLNYARLSFFFDENENGVPYTEFDYYVVDSFGTQALETDTMTININPVNDAPTVINTIVSPQTAWINDLTGLGEEFSLDASTSFEDVDLNDLESTEALSYSLTGTLPAWTLNVDSNGLITGTSDGSDAGASYNVEVTVTDTGGESVQTSFTLNVDSAYGPEMDGVVTPQSATEDTLFTLDFSAIDQDSFDSELVFTIVEDYFTATYGTDSTFETDATLTNNYDGTASLSWIPTNDDVGVHTLTVAVTDVNGAGMTDEVTFQITVANVNDAPEVEDVDDDEAYENIEFTLDFTVTDPDGDSISVDSWDVDCNEDCDLSSLDLDLGDDLTQSGNTFTITWTPDNDDADSNNDEVEHDVEIVFSDGTDTASLHFTITVGEELTGWEIDINDLETLYEEYKDDFDNFEDDLRDAEDDDDENDIEDAEDDLDELDDDLKDLEDELDQLEEDIEDDDTLSSSEEDDLLEWIEDIRTDVEDLRDDIDDLLRYGTDGSSTDGESASESSSSSSSSSSSDNGDDDPEVEVTTLDGPSSSSDSSTSSDDKKTTWDELRGLAWLIAGIVIAFAVFIFLLAVLMTGGKKRAPAQ